MSRPMRIMLISLVILFGLIFLYKFIAGLLMRHFFATHANPVVTVSTTVVKEVPWQQHLNAVGSARAIRGVNVTTELAGMVQKIYFTPGADVKEGEVLVQLNADTEIGQLQSLKAQVEVARITYERDKQQYAIRAVSKQQLDNDFYNWHNLIGQAASQAATVAKKTIRAPFTGRVGVSNVNPGQYLNVGDTVTNLQTLDPIWVDFYLPQQNLALLKLGEEVTVTTDTFPNQSYKGTITTIQPAVDSSTRNVQVEATIANPKFELAPGMFTRVEVKVGEPATYLTLPTAAISFNPYGDIVYIVNETKDEDGKKVLSVRQSFVTTGETRGDQITILSGLKAGQTVVSSGQLKLKNNSRIRVDNRIQPNDNPAPRVTNDHTE